jgi:hypothetical protein
MLPTKRTCPLKIDNSWVKQDTSTEARRGEANTNYSVKIVQLFVSWICYAVEHINKSLVIDDNLLWLLSIAIGLFLLDQLGFRYMSCLCFVPTGICSMKVFRG